MTPPLKLFWKQNVGANFKNEIIEHNDLVFVCSDTLKVYESDGDFYWEFKTETPTTTTAFVTDNTVIIGCEDGKIIGIDIPSHMASWEIESNGKIAQGICGTDDYCYIANSYGTLFKLIPDTGTKIFQTMLDAPLSFGPVLSEYGLIIGDDDGNLYGLDSESGSKKWSSSVADSRIGGILLDEDKVFFGSYDNKVYCVGIENGEKLWETRVNGWIEKTPVIVRDKLFVKVRETMLTSFDPETGESLWSKETQPSSSELLVCDDIIYFGDNRRLSSISSAYIIQQYFEFSEEQITSISLIGDKIYLGLSVGFSDVGRIACMIPDGSIRVSPQVVEETISTTDENPEITITVSNTKDDMVG
ncbi:MAG: PQQ-binding-like beta-propeller repeat protein [Caldisericia bacterium]